MRPLVAAACAVHLAIASVHAAPQLVHPESTQRGHYETLADVRDALGASQLWTALGGAANWLTDTAQINSTDLPPDCRNGNHYAYTDWYGAYRGEYDVGSGVFDFFGPVWHGGQAIKALVLASQAPPPSLDPPDDGVHKGRWLASAQRGAQFILEKQVTTGPDAGLILAYEQPDHPGSPHTSTILEALDGLFLLANATGNASYATRALWAANWTLEHAWMQGQGLLHDLYNQTQRQWIPTVGNALTHAEGRPLVDDSVWLTAAQRVDASGAPASAARYRTAFYEVIDTLLADESPAGNWVDYVPCSPDPADPGKGVLHPRQAFWWGLPFVHAYRDSHNATYLQVAARAAAWYVNASRADGGMFRHTQVDFTTSTYGQVTSGVACACILWIELFQAAGDVSLLPAIEAGLKFVMQAQFGQSTHDPSIRGSVIELSHPPSGTDAVSPYHLRDIATSFALQAYAKLLIGAAERP